MEKGGGSEEAPRRETDQETRRATRRIATGKCTQIGRRELCRSLGLMPGATSGSTFFGIHPSLDTSASFQDIFSDHHDD